MPDNFDPNLIQDPALRQVVLFLMNQVEALAARVKSQAQEIQRLRDENNRLKSEQAKPDIKPNLAVLATRVIQLSLIHFKQFFYSYGEDLLGLETQ